MDWFEAITGFVEADYVTTKSQLFVDGNRLCSVDSERSCGVGTFSLPSLKELREIGIDLDQGKTIKVSNVVGDVRDLHSRPENAGALFQVASQFNMLEMIGPRITPEHGVTRYQYDPTQGPGCAVAAGAATIYRNYFVECGNQSGQTAEHQLNGFADVAAEIERALGRTGAPIVPVTNGYALPEATDLKAISDLLDRMLPLERDQLFANLRIGLHEDVEVTDVVDGHPPKVSQAFCSAMPVAYSGLDATTWEPLARAVLDAAYEATLWAAMKNAASGRSNRVLLTRLGGGAFGNRDQWIDDAMTKTIEKFRMSGLEILIVSYGPKMKTVQDLAGRHR